MSRVVPLLLPVPDHAAFTFAPPPPPPPRWHEDEPPRPICFIIGVDLGQARDFSAIVINEVSHVARAHMETDARTRSTILTRREVLAYHRIRHVERIPLGTSYPDVLGRVAEVVARVPRMPREPVLVMDATGCGRPVMDLARKSGLAPIGVTITAGGAETVGGDDARVAKKLLASGVAVALDTGRLAVVAVGPHVDVLRDELRAFRVKVTPDRNETFESWREADHDDLVLATALTVWAGERLRERFRVNPAWSLMGGM